MNPFAAYRRWRGHTPVKSRGLANWSWLALIHGYGNLSISNDGKPVTIHAGLAFLTKNLHISIEVFAWAWILVGLAGLVVAYSRKPGPVPLVAGLLTALTVFWGCSYLVGWAITHAKAYWMIAALYFIIARGIYYWSRMESPPPKLDELPPLGKVTS